MQFVSPNYTQFNDSNIFPVMVYEFAGTSNFSLGTNNWEAHWKILNIARAI
jgi:hypothetical protein